MTQQSWDPDRYQRNARFVSDLAGPVVELLAPEPGERILDLGCGDGVVTEALAAMGCRVVGVDSSPEQVDAARRRGVDARVMDGERLTFETEYDAVFSNAALHWMKRSDDVIDGVWRALVPGGRFVAECGGEGNIAKIEAALLAALDRRGIDGTRVSPWYYPSTDEYRGRLTARGFVVRSIDLVPRPTLLSGDITGWLEVFAGAFVGIVPAADRAGFIDEVRERVRPELCGVDGRWTADYVRLRFAAVRPPASTPG